MMIPTHFFKKLNQRGAAMLEMALTIPLFVALLLALVDFGMYFTTRSVLQSAAYNGAKTACVDSAANVDTMVKTTVGTVVDLIKYPTKITITPATFIGVAPLRRAKVVLSCSGEGTTPSIFTSGLGLYPITTTGVAKCL